MWYYIQVPYKDPEKQRAYQRERLAKARRDWIKENGPCWCGSTTKLEVDHMDPSKKTDHKVWSWSPSRRAKELEKCQVLCKKHHQEKTLSQIKRTTHGETRMYDLGCRCDKCRDIKSIRNATYRRKNPLSSKGRTLDFESSYRGSNPCNGTNY